VFIHNLLSSTHTLYLPLVHAQLADIGLQEKDVRALHARVEDLHGESEVKTNG
jgi:hypothetical protein